MQNPIKPIQLGKLTLPSNLVQGPLAGYSCAPFRVVMEQHGQPGFCATEMISSHDLASRPTQPKRYTFRDPREGILCFQLSGSKPAMFAKAISMIADRADMIDLNCGCPVKKIRSKGAGSKLLASPETIYQLVREIKQNSDSVASIKIRIAGEYGDHSDLDVVDAAQSAGVDFITVHGRHWRERYDVPCQFAAIKKICAAATVPVFANGDLEDTQSIQHCFAQTGCDGFMIARAGVGQPWLFKKIRAELNGETFIEPTIAERGDILLQHISGLIELESEKLAILQSRKLAKYYSRDLPNRTEFVLAMQQACDFRTVQTLVKQHYNFINV